MRDAAERARHLENFDFRDATAPLVSVVSELNRYIEESRPWALVTADPERCGAVLGTLVRSCQGIADALAPFVPVTAQRLRSALDTEGANVPITPAFARIEVPGRRQVPGLVPSALDPG